MRPKQVYSRKVGKRQLQLGYAGGLKKLVVILSIVVFFCLFQTLKSNGHIDGFFSAAGFIALYLYVVYFYARLIN